MAQPYQIWWSDSKGWIFGNNSDGEFVIYRRVVNWTSAQIGRLPDDAKQLFEVERATPPPAETP